MTPSLTLVRYGTLHVHSTGTNGRFALPFTIDETFAKLQVHCDFLDLVGWLATFATSMYNMYRIGTPCHHHLVIWAVAWRGQSSTADQLTLLCADRALALKYCNLYKVYNSSTDYRYHGVTMRKLVNGI